jgi:pantoate--beta-alanine ligase
MGALHEGHVALIEFAKQTCDVVIVSVFVNALQFQDDTDFEKYPRTLDDDYSKSILAGAAVVFAPTNSEIFPSDFDDYVTAPPVSSNFEGSARPGHFDGVATVVNRLFKLVQPHVAVFGAKDYQQVAVIRTMSAELHPSIIITSIPTVRDYDGLALSSRNIRLSATGRKNSLVIPQALDLIQQMSAEGTTDATVLKHHAYQLLQTEPSLNVEYLEIVHPQTLEIQHDSRNSVVLIAGEIDGVRLIDNISIV